VTPDPAHAMLMAQAMMGHMVERQSIVVAFDDIFRLMSWMFIAALVMVPFCKPPKEGASPAMLAEAH
jgi:DHA2 family multidrug resistance protein